MKKKESALSARHQRFADEYLIDFNAARAARAAGYSATTANEQGCRLSTKHNIQTYIKGKTQDIAMDYESTRKSVIAGLIEIINTNIWDCFDQDEDMALHLKPVSELPRAVESLVVSDDGEKITVTLADKTKAMELLGRHLGFFKDNMNVNITLSATDRATKSEKLLFLEERLGNRHPTSDVDTQVGKAE